MDTSKKNWQVLSIYRVPGTMLNILQMPSLATITIFIPLLKTRKLI